MKKSGMKWIYRAVALAAILYLLMLDNKGDIEYIYANF